MYSEFFSFNNDLEKFFSTKGELVTYEKGQHIVWGKEKSQWVFFLKSGLVRISFSLPNHTQRIIGYMVPGHVFAQTGSFINDPNGEVSFIAEAGENNIAAYRMKIQTFLKCLHTDPALMQDYTQMTLRNQMVLIERIVYQGEKGLYLKCVRWLLFMAKYYSITKGNKAEITIPLTQDVAAEFLHTTRESLNAVFGELKEQKLISIARKRVTILNVPRLRKLLS